MTIRRQKISVHIQSKHVFCIIRRCIGPLSSDVHFLMRFGRHMTPTVGKTHQNKLTTKCGSTTGCYWIHSTVNKQCISFKRKNICIYSLKKMVWTKLIEIQTFCSVTGFQEQQCGIKYSLSQYSLSFLSRTKQCHVKQGVSPADYVSYNYIHPPISSRSDTVIFLLTRHQNLLWWLLLHDVHVHVSDWPFYRTPYRLISNMF